MTDQDQRGQAPFLAKAGSGLSFYRYCGLTLASELPLPELPPAVPESAPDLHIQVGAVPRTLDREIRRTATYAHDGREALWWLADIGHFQVSPGGRQITVEPAPGADQAGVRLMLLHPVFALASVLRGDWLLNAAAVERDGEVSAFIGPSASGKSTAAAWLRQRGFRLVSDSQLRLALDPTGRFLAYPQAPWMLLWPESLGHLGLTGELQTPARPGIDLRWVAAPDLAEPRPLARIGLLREQRGNDLDDFALRPRRGFRAFEILLQHLAGNTWLDQLAARQALFQWGARLAAQTRVEQLDMPWGWDQHEALGEQLAAWCLPSL